MTRRNRPVLAAFRLDIAAGHLTAAVAQVFAAYYSGGPMTRRNRPVLAALNLDIAAGQ